MTTFFYAMIHLDLRKWIYIRIENPFKTMWKLRGVFKPLKCYFTANIKNSWFPMIWCSNPAFIHIMSVDVGWKDKYDTPRYEYPPAIWIHLFGLNLIWYWKLKNQSYMDDYWEQALWYLYYYRNISYGTNEPNIKKAKDSWPWTKVTSFDDVSTESTWDNTYLSNG